MKNPFEKEYNKGLIAAALLGTAAISAIAYLFLTDKGTKVRGKAKKRLKAFAKDKGVAAISKRTKVPKKIIKAVL